MNCIRFLFCFYNFLFLLIGGSILGIGIWFSLDPQANGVFKEMLKRVGETDEQAANNILEAIRQASFVLIAFGGFIFLLSFLGYCGSIKESRFLLGFYAFLLGLILILEIAAVILVFLIYGPQIEEETKTVLKDNLIGQYEHDKGITQFIDEVMNNTKCCGIYNGSDFKGNTILISKGFQVPMSCCRNETNPCMQSPTDENSYTEIGCFDEIKKDIMTERAKFSIIAVTIVVVILQILGVVFSCWIYKDAKYSFD